jgi:hypothetical protein
MVNDGSYILTIFRERKLNIRHFSDQYFIHHPPDPTSTSQRHHRTTRWIPGLNRGVTFISSFSPQPQLLTAPQASCYTAVLRSEKRHSHCPWNRPRKQLALLSLLEGHLNWSSGMLASRWAQLPVSLLIKHKSGWKCGRG